MSAGRPEVSDAVSDASAVPPADPRANEDAAGLVGVFRQQLQANGPCQCRNSQDTCAEQLSDVGQQLSEGGWVLSGISQPTKARFA